MTAAPFPTDPVRTRIARAYRNLSYIADDVLPRVPTLGAPGKEEFKYLSYPLEESFRAPDATVGRRGKPSEVVLSATEVADTCLWYALDDPIPQTDLNNAPDGYDVLDRSTEQLTDYLSILREKRTADLLFDAAQYPSGYKVTLSGTSQWSDFANSDPIGVLRAALDAPLMPPNVVVMGADVWSKLSVHPKVVKAVNGNAGDSGVARRRQLAELLEVEEVLVGAARVATSKYGQAATIGRIWGKHCAVLYRNRAAGTQGGVTFGYTAEARQREVGQIPDPHIGALGGVYNRVRECVKELIVASRAGYLIVDAVA